MNSPSAESADISAIPCRPSGDAPVEQQPLRHNRERFDQLVLPHLLEAYGLARWLTRNDADAQDVIQDASIRAWRGIGTLATDNARAWVSRIVRNTAFDWLRKNRPAGLTYVDEWEELAGQHTGSEECPEKALLNDECESQLENAMARLRAPFQDILLSRDMHGLAYREIAELHQVSIGTVMSRLYRARKQLAQLLGENDCKPPDQSL